MEREGGVRKNTRKGRKGIRYCVIRKGRRKIELGRK